MEDDFTILRFILFLTMGTLVVGVVLRSGREAFEQRALAGQRINVGRPQVRVSVEAQVAPALVVGEDDDEVGLRGFFGGDRVTAPTDHD